VSKATAAKTVVESQYLEAGIAVQRLTRDLANGAKRMSPNEARFLVDYYYICQDDRMRFLAQVRAMSASEESTMVLDWLGSQATTMEGQVKRALDKYTDEHPVGAWIKSLYGFGPVLAAGLVAHIDIEKAPTAGHIWSYAGLIPGQKWNKGEKRPWNAELKKLCFKIGECMVKFAGNEECFYGHIFRDRRQFEWDNNLNGRLSHQATLDKDKYSNSAESYAWVNGMYHPDDVHRLRTELDSEGSIPLDQLKKIKRKAGEGVPMLPPAQIHARARRYAVKLFLSHLHTVWYEMHFKCRPPNPFVIEHLGHAHYIQVPNYTSPFTGTQPGMVFKVKKDHKDTDN
jgi:hypothetical protein